MILGTHILDIGLSKVLQLPLHLFTNTYYDLILCLVLIRIYFEVFAFLVISIAPNKAFWIVNSLFLDKSIGSNS